MKRKFYTEKEIMDRIDKWVDECDKLFETSDIMELKRKFMTSRGFREAIEEAGLVGTQFD